MGELLRVAEVAKILRVNIKQVYEFINEGKLKAVKIGSLKVKSSELERFINEHEVGGEFNESN